MDNFWNAMENEYNNMNNLTYTENGAVAYKSSGSKMLDAFGTLGAMRNEDENVIISTFEQAFNEDRALALKLLFYMRDIRGGQGQRRVFRTILKWLGDNHTDCVVNNLENILYFGRGDDYLCLLHTSAAEEVYEFMKQQISQDTLNMYANKEVSLLAKWLPSENTSSKKTREYANSIIRVWRWTPRRYRKVISELRKYIDVTERKMSAKEWKKINYESVPAKASMIYSDAFYRHDETGYVKYIQSLANGGKVNAGSLFPVDIVHKAKNANNPSMKDRVLWDAMWKALPDYVYGRNETGICVVDTSGSMWGLPLEVALSLGMYCADRCNGPFKGKFITFSSDPQLVELKGSDIYEKLHNIREIVDSTNIQAVFELILQTAVKNKMKQEDLPSKLYIISDMQFNAATSSSWFSRNNNGWVKTPFMQIMRDKFERAGYKLPALVYWNVRASNCGMFHQTVGGEDCCMVSGYSPSLFKSIIQGTTYEEVVKEDGTKTVKEVVDPINVMLATLNNSRYDRVVC